MRRLLCLLLSVMILLGMLSACGINQAKPTNPVQDTEQYNTQPTQTRPTEPSAEDIIHSLEQPDLWKQELLYASELGFPMDKVQQKTISGAEMAELLDHFIEYAAPDKLDEWKALLPNLRTHQGVLTRFDAMGALFLAARMVGSDWSEFKEDFTSTMNRLQFPWDDYYFTEGLFGEHDSPKYTVPDRGNSNYLDGASLPFNLSRKSSISGESPFAYDIEANSIHEYDRPTYTEGLLAVVRLILSNKPYVYVPTEVDAVYLDAADVRREEIRTAVTELPSTVTGNIYYISNSGSDDNDGCSPETAWATPYRAMTANLQYGDAVLFERDGTWYIPMFDDQGNVLTCLEYEEGVTIGAYGSGEKPIIRGDIPGANNPNQWELYYDQNGAKIWKYADNLRDSSVIVFNEGESYASEVMPWWDGGSGLVNHQGDPFVVEDELTKDLTFCSMLQYTFSPTDTINQILHQTPMTGPLYLRCDAGNPAEVYQSVSIPQLWVSFGIHPDSTVYDLDIRYFTQTGIGVTSAGATTWNQSFINLDISWCGGFLQGMDYQEQDGAFIGYRPYTAGGGINIQSNDAGSVVNCRLNQCGPFALIAVIHNHSGDARVDLKNLLLSGNLIENSATALHMAGYAALDYPGTESFYSNIVFEDNLVMNTGDTWYCDTIGGNTIACNVIENKDGAANNDGIYIRDNTFYCGTDALVCLRDTCFDMSPVNAQPVFSGNAYVQFATRPLLQKNWSSEIYYPKEDVVRDILGDETGSLVVIG